MTMEPQALHSTSLAGALSVHQASLDLWGVAHDVIPSQPPKSELDDFDFDQFIDTAQSAPPLVNSSPATEAHWNSTPLAPATLAMDPEAALPGAPADALFAQSEDAKIRANLDVTTSSLDMPWLDRVLFAAEASKFAQQQQAMGDAQASFDVREFFGLSLLEPIPEATALVPQASNENSEEVSFHIQEQSATSIAPVALPKRRPGRPRKHPLPEATAAPSSVSTIQADVTARSSRASEASKYQTPEEDDVSLDVGAPMGFIVDVPARPMDPELAAEYALLRDPSLPAKQRRQLRNKLSARSFREKRVDYIAALEAEVVKLRTEVSQYQAERDAARSDAAQAKAEMEGMAARLKNLDLLESKDDGSSRKRRLAPHSPESVVADMETTPQQAQRTFLSNPPLMHMRTGEHISRQFITQLQRPIAVHAITRLPSPPPISPMSNLLPNGHFTADVGRRLLDSAKKAKKLGDISSLVEAVVVELFRGTVPAELIVSRPHAPAAPTTKSSLDVDAALEQILGKDNSVIDPEMVKMIIILLLGSV